MNLSDINNELLLTKLVDITSLQIYVYDIEENKILYTNRSIVRGLGYTTDDLIQFGEQILEKVLHPEDLANFPKRIEKLSALKDEEELLVEERYKKASGVYGWFRNTRKVFKRNANGTVQQVIGCIHEITEQINNQKKLQATEDKFKAIFNSTSDFNFFVDKDLNIITLNQAAILYTEKYAGIKLLPGDNLTIAMPPEMKVDALMAMQVALQGEIVDSTKEYKSVDGKNIWFRAKFFPVYDELQNTITGVNVNMRDVTKTVHSSIALEQQNKQLKEIARINSHEIRRPLANILGLIEMLGHYENELTDDIKDLIDLLHQSSAELDEVVKRIVSTASKK